MSIKKTDPTPNPGPSDEDKLKAARKRKSQAKKPKPAPTADQDVEDEIAASIADLQRAEQDFANFQDNLRRKLEQTILGVQQTGQQVAEIQHSLPRVFEQAYAGRKAELEAQGGSRSQFPRVDCTSRPAFAVSEPVQKLIPGSAAGSTGSGTANPAADAGPRAAD